jgi:hypothetical protein
MIVCISSIRSSLFLQSARFWVDDQHVRSMPFIMAWKLLAWPVRPLNNVILPATCHDVITSLTESPLSHLCYAGVNGLVLRTSTDHLAHSYPSLTPHWNLSCYAAGSLPQLRYMAFFITLSISCIACARKYCVRPDTLHQWRWQLEEFFATRIPCNTSSYNHAHATYLAHQLMPGGGQPSGNDGLPSWSSQRHGGWGWFLKLADSDV